MRLFVRRLHRWLGLLLALQITAWMFSGFYFSLFPIAEVRGEHLTRPPEPLRRDAAAGALPPVDALAAVDRHLQREWTLGTLRLHSLGEKGFWRVEGTVDGAAFVRLVDFETGRVRPALSAGQAEQRAQGLLLAPGVDPRVEWVESQPDNMEFRDRPLPVWRVSFAEPEDIHLYLDPWTGELLARRTDRWRVFDFLWMLHTMDFQTRDDFNKPLLQVAAFLGLLVTLGGFVLWAVTTRVLRRGRRAA